jgi:hypothetical protein
MTGPPISPHLADERLDDYVDGLLDAPARAAAQAHLAACARCAAALDELRTLLALSAAERGPVEPPAALWPRVVAATSERAFVRRRLLRSLRAPLLAAAVVLVALTSWATARVASRAPADVAGHAARVVLDEDAALDRMLESRDAERGPIPRERIRTLRARLAAADASIRGAPDDEALYRALAERERVLADVRAVLGRGPRPPRPPIPPR